MTPKEKAQELTNRIRISLLKNSDPMNMLAPFNYSLASKECALIAVDEIINGNFGDGYDHQFWESVKQETINL